MLPNCAVFPPAINRVNRESVARPPNLQAAINAGREAFSPRGFKGTGIEALPGDHRRSARGIETRRVGVKA